MNPDGTFTINPVHLAIFSFVVYGITDSAKEILSPDAHPARTRWLALLVATAIAFADTILGPDVPPPITAHSVWNTLVYALLLAGGAMANHAVKGKKPARRLGSGAAGTREAGSQGRTGTTAAARLAAIKAAEGNPITQEEADAAPPVSSHPQTGALPLPDATGENFIEKNFIRIERGIK